MTLEPEDFDSVAPNSPNLTQAHSLPSGLKTPSSGSGPGDELEDLRTQWFAEKQVDKESERQKEKSRPKDIERQRQWASEKRERESEVVEDVNGQEIKRGLRHVRSASVREEGRLWEKKMEKGGGSFREKVFEQEQTRGEKRELNRQSKRQHKRDVEKEVGQKHGAKRSGSSGGSPAVTPSSQEGGLSNNQVRKYSSLNSILLSFTASGTAVCLSTFC